MSVEVRGIEEVLRQLEQRLGAPAIQRISDRALKEGAAVFVAELERQLLPFKKKGHTIEEITMSAPHTFNGERRITVHWKGPHGRYRIIHLNEFGTVKNPNPPAKGAIARALQASERTYFNAVKRAIEEGM